MVRNGKLGTLVLSRKKEEWIDINGGVENCGFGIVITEIRGDKVRLGFLAPKDVKIHRREVQKAINEEQKEGLDVDG
jgi:carbon storage regulator